MSVFLQNIRKLTESEFKTAWEAAHPTVKIRFPNVVWKQPAGEYVQFTINWGVANQLSIGSTKKEEQNGIVTITVHAALGEGSKRALELADAAQAVFRYKQLAEGTTVVNFYEAGVGAMTEGPTHFALNATCRFRAEGEF